jgi:hypothetical protein
MRRARRIVLLWIAAASVLVLAMTMIPAGAVGAAKTGRGSGSSVSRQSQIAAALQRIKGDRHLRLAPAGLPKVAAGPQGRPANNTLASSRSQGASKPGVEQPIAPTSASGAATLYTVSTAATPASNEDPIDLKVLVLSADGTEVTLPAIKQQLDFLGIPYTVKQMAPLPSDANSDRLTTELFSGIHAFYQAVILTTGDLVYTPDNGGTFLSALTTTEWNALNAFEASFGIRQVSWYTFPTPTYGFSGNATAVDTTTSPMDVPFTAAGQTVFGSYLKTSTPLRIADAYTYLDTPLDAATTPLLTDAAGHALAAIRDYPDGRQNLSLTFASNQYLLHSLLLSYGLVNWVTRGLFLGERHVYLSPQEDDLFIDDAIWQPTTACGTTPDDPSLPTYRITGTELHNILNWQNGLRAQPTTANFRVNHAFNGVGTTSEFYTEYRADHPSAPSTDTLTARARADRAGFYWTSHTYNHANLDSISYNDARSELTSNDQVARNLGLPNYSKLNLVQPDVSGLTNPNFMSAARDFGIRYVISDTSRGGFSDNPSPNTGVVNPLQPSVLQIPRRPVNLYFNVSTPAQWLAEDNCLYPTGAFGHVDTVNQLLDRESSVLLSYLAKGDIDPIMFHQPNMASYSGTNSLMSDLLGRTISRYNQYFTLPISSLSQDQIGARMASRAQYNASGVTASIVPGLPGQPPQSITITAQRAATVPVTGLRTAGAELYGGQYISYVTLAAGQSITLGPAAVLNPTSLNFGLQFRGTTSPAKTVTLTNSGPFPLSVTGITITGDFSQTNNCPATLSAQTSCTISVRFRPTGSFTRTGTLSVTDNAPGSPQKVALSGLGL